MSFIDPAPEDGGGGSGLTEPVSVDDNNGSLTVDSPQLPATLDADGGVKVHVKNPSAGGGGLTDVELRATPVPVSGTVSVVEPVTVDGTVAVNNFPGTQP